MALSRVEAGGRLPKWFSEKSKDRPQKTTTMRCPGALRRWLDREINACSLQRTSTVQRPTRAWGFFDKESNAIRFI